MNARSTAMLLHIIYSIAVSFKRRNIFHFSPQYYNLRLFITTYAQADAHMYACYVICVCHMYLMSFSLQIRVSLVSVQTV